MADNDGVTAQAQATEGSAPQRDIISQKNANNSPLLRLPAEIRNRIYQYALSDRVLVPAAMSSKSESSMHNLPLTCRQLYQETHLLVHRYDIFEVRHPEEFVRPLGERTEIKNSITEVKVHEVLVQDIVFGQACFIADTPRLSAFEQWKIAQYLKKALGELPSLKKIARLFTSLFLSSLDPSLDGKILAKDFVKTAVSHEVAANLDIVFE